jgi:hypothetical protein
MSLSWSDNPSITCSVDILARQTIYQLRANKRTLVIDHAAIYHSRDPSRFLHLLTDEDPFQDLNQDVPESR